MSKFGKNNNILLYYIMSFSLCKGKRTSRPNVCTKVKGCKVLKSKGSKRAFCRKKHNKTKKNRKNK